MRFWGEAVNYYSVDGKAQYPACPRVGREPFRDRSYSTTAHNMETRENISHLELSGLTFDDMMRLEYQCFL